MHHTATVFCLSLLLVGCESGRPPEPEPTHATVTPGIRMGEGMWYCKEFDNSPQHYIEYCYFEVMVDASDIPAWDRIGCFGEFQFTQVDEGRVRTFPKTFFDSVDGQDRYWPQPLKIFSFTYFKESHIALDPKLAWYQCDVMDSAHDRVVPERPLK